MLKEDAVSSKTVEQQPQPNALTPEQMRQGRLAAVAANRAPDVAEALDISEDKAQALVRALLT